MNRLKTAKSAATSGSDCWGLDYTYDRYANLTNAAISSGRGGTGCSAPTLNLAVSTSTNKIGNEGFQYDAAGNLTNDGFSTYTWNAEGRMASTAGVTYTYDGDGRRVKKSNGTLYWYGIGGQLLEETDLSGTLISDYGYFGGMRIARRDANGSVYYFLADRLGNARILTNSTGGVVEESDFYPFGVERPIIDTLNNKFKFTGHERDAESGLDHTLFRQYSCNTGRWLSPDSVRGSLTDPQSWNRYAYVRNNPVNAIDPDGSTQYFCIETTDTWADPPSVIRTDCWCISGCSSGGTSFDACDWGAPCPDELQDQMDAAAEKQELANVKDWAEGILAIAFMNLDTSNCGAFLRERGRSISDIKAHASAMTYLNVNGLFANDTAYSWVGNSTDGTRIGDYLTMKTNHGTFYAEGRVLTDRNNNASDVVVVDVERIMNEHPQMQMALLLHEVLHSAFNMNDDQLADFFGIRNPSDMPGRTRYISEYLANDCRIPDYWPRQ